MNTAKVWRRGQLTLPKDIREELDIDEGQRVAFVRRGGSISLLPLNESLANHYGSIDVEGPQDFDALRAEARRRKAQERVQADVSSETAQSDAQ